ncbi:hypothetical protein DPV79_15990 [Burkholderia reimsis]|uniref:Uncharacterized protein n=1 Tax=Burkholderia reimsis TaxID=2234132 RepID=A0A365QVL1_9BURK|nr:hypothetical protein [Burkholderia reimsis]RBB38880.1 hypothetical protein DPV79_15990 [Burkholderia reimsis]
MIKNAGRYAKVRARLWADEKFGELSRLAPSGQALWLYLLTGPHTASIPGLYRLTTIGIADRLHWPLDRVRSCMAEVVEMGMAHFDDEHGFLYLPKSIEYDPPANPNVVRSWVHFWTDLPECDLKRQAYAALREFVASRGDGFAAAFDQVIDMPTAAPRKRNRSANGSGNGSGNGSPEFDVMQQGESAQSPAQQGAGNGLRNGSANPSPNHMHIHKHKTKVKSKDMSFSQAYADDDMAEAADVVREVFEYWQLVMSSPRSRLDDNRRGLILRAIKRGYSVSDLKEAIRGCSRSPFHMGDNDRQTAFNGLDLILRNAEKIDEFRKINANPPVAGRVSAPRSMTAAERRKLESDQNMRDFLDATKPNGRALPDDPFTIDMEPQ